MSLTLGHTNPSEQQKREFRELLGLAPSAPTLTAVPSSRSVRPEDLNSELSVASGITLTVPTDLVLGIVDTPLGVNSSGIAIYVAGAAAPTVVTTGLTIVGTAPTMAQYGWYALKRVGVNTWSWV